ncbi:MAG TPA: energy transducer TonB, partial [Steroidobacteraceae bacterium]|nr:energy transducer TonB [Steroidobacteraceae bacterium]
MLSSSPVDPRKTHAVFGGVAEEAAARKKAAHAAQLAHTAHAEPATPPTPAAADDFDQEPTLSAAALQVIGMNGAKSRTLLIAGACLAVAVLAAGAWFLTRGPGTAPVQPSAVVREAPVAAPVTAPAAEGPESTLPLAPSADLAILHGKVDELLEKARLAMRERRYTEPIGDNALVYYRSAVAADATNGEARDGLQRVAAVIAGRLDESLNAGRLDEAALNLASLKAAAPDDRRTTEFAARLAAAQFTKALAEGSLERAAGFLRQAQQSAAVPADQLAKWKSDLARRQDDVKTVLRLAGLVEDRIRDGKLVDPAGDSAKAYLGQLLSAYPSSLSAQRVQRELTSAYLRKAHDAGVARNSAEAERWLNEARAAGAAPADISTLQRDLAGAQAKAVRSEGDRLAQLARERVRDGRLTDPAQDSAAYYLTQLQSADPDNAALAAVSRDLAGKLLDRARTATQAGRSADLDLSAARRFGADPKDILGAQQSGAKGTNVDPATLAAGLKALRTEPPEYPAGALEHRMTGSVLLSYTVDGKGNPRDVQILQSTPTGVFDRAAMNAVKRWKYAPVIVNGAPVEV